MEEGLTRKIDRLFWIINDRNIAIKNFENSCGISNGNLYKIRTNKKTDLTWNMLSRIIENTKFINTDWLINGTGSPYNKNIDNQVQQNNHDNSKNTQNVYTGINKDVVDLLNSTIETLRNELENKQKTIDSLNNTINTITAFINNCKSTAN